MMLPKRDILALIEALRIRALALTGAAWERDATRDMMNEAAGQLENFTILFKPDVAYMPVPRCETCRHWQQGKHAGDYCRLLYITIPTDFGCVRWEVK